jgi:hypothetical protein
LRTRLDGCTRLDVLNITGGACFYCAEPLTLDTMQPDHMTPKSRGGSDKLENLAPACRFCNGQKANRTVPEYRTYLLGRGIVPMFFGDGSPLRDWLLIATPLHAIGRRRPCSSSPSRED